jgi:CRISPR-associated endoribonuclease Cas6
MPITIQLRLKASWPVRPDTRQLHGMACALFESDNADHRGHDKPFAAWPVSQPLAGTPTDWEWRASWLPARLPPASALAPERLRLGHVRCTVTEASHRVISHTQIAAGPPADTVTAAFRSPTYFAQNGTVVVLPDPRLIVGSWRRRWNTSLLEAGPLVIDDEAWRLTHQALHLAEFNLNTEKRDSGRGHQRSGFTGSATLRLARDAPEVARNVLGTLARFAEFCGTGAQTTHGFGATTIFTKPAT